MASTPNNTANVSVGKGVQGGYMFIAPAGTTLPSDNSTALIADYLNFGYLGDDGIVFADSADTENYQDINGDNIETSNGSIEKTVTVTFREIKKDTLATIYGSDNVTDTGGKLTVHDKGPNDASYVLVFELLLKNGRKWRRIAPNAKLGELGDMTHTYNELVGREITFNVLKDNSTNDYWVDYIDSTETATA